MILSGQDRLRRLGLAATFAIVGLYLFAEPSTAGSTESFGNGSGPDSALSVALARIEGAALSLPEAIRIGLESASPVREARQDFIAAREVVRREKGSFDPSLFADFSRSSDDAKTASAFAGAPVLKTRESTGSAGARIRSSFGTDLTAGVSARRTTTNSSFASLNPQYDAFGSLTLTQPLLKGFGPASRQDLTAAERSLEAARAGYEDAALAVRAQIEALYWDLYAAERDRAVQQLIVERAQALLDETRTRATAGLVGPSATASARVFLAEQQQALLDREEDLDRTSDQLASLIGSRPPAGQTRFRPTDDPPARLDVPPADSLVVLAIRRNAAIEALRAQARSLRAHERGAVWNELPQIDFVGSIGGSGLSGTGRDVVFGSDTLRADSKGNLNESLRQVGKRTYPNWSAGVRFSMPIFWRAERGERERLRAAVRGAEERTNAGERAIEERVRAAHRALAHADQRLDAARDGVDASLEQVRIGLIEYRNGRSTAFEVVRLGADLASAQQRYSQALVRAAQATAEIRYLTAEDPPVLEME
jgi:outer membrane protein TolC